MEIEDFDFITRCRAILIESIVILDRNIIFNYGDDEDSKLVDDLRTFFFWKKFESKGKRKDIYMLIHSIHFHNERYYYESELTQQRLYRLVNMIGSYQDYLRLLNSITPEQVNLISNLSTEFLEYLRAVWATRKKAEQNANLSLIPQ